MNNSSKKHNSFESRIASQLFTSQSIHKITQGDFSFLYTLINNYLSLNNNPIKIVFRPAYSQEVIVYYGAEKDALDYADAELWVDDGTQVWQVSLGHILKKNNIKKFPI